MEFVQLTRKEMDLMTDKECRSFVKLVYITRQAQRKYFELHRAHQKAKKTYEDAVKAKMEQNSLQYLSKQMLEVSEERDKQLKTSTALETRLDAELKRLYAKAEEINKNSINRIMEVSNYGKN